MNSKPIPMSEYQVVEDESGAQFRNGMNMPVPEGYRVIKNAPIGPEYWHLPRLHVLADRPRR